MNLSGEVNGKEKSETERKRRPYHTIAGFRLDETKSALQKAIRRKNVEEAEFRAWEHSRSHPQKCWERLKIIATEDVSDPLLTVAVDVLEKQAKEMGFDDEEGRRLPILAAKWLAEADGDKEAQRAIEYFEERDKEGVDWTDEYPIKDCALDGHTQRGRRMGRGAKFWALVSGLVKEEELSPANKKYRKWLFEKYTGVEWKPEFDDLEKAENLWRKSEEGLRPGENLTGTEEA